MSAHYRLWFGPAAAFLLSIGILAIGQAIPDYSHVRQTVSELGEIGSPGRIAFSALLLLVAAFLAIFADGAARALRRMGHSSLPAYLIGAMAISTAGVGIFPFPDPLHNVFGMSELVGYQAPLVAAVAATKDRSTKGIAVFSVSMYAVVLLAIAMNMSVLDRHGDIWIRVQPFYGIVQRALFTAWFLWCAGYGVLLMNARRRDDHSLM
ncbi:MAG TPA: DUF998 domain-containing protein [Povalibacter sp.]|nr:DUF998 domain-containing protein [Povalibacter sp.]